MVATLVSHPVRLRGRVRGGNDILARSATSIERQTAPNRLGDHADVGTSKRTRLADARHLDGVLGDTFSVSHSFARVNDQNAKPWWSGETAIRVSDMPNHVPRLPSGKTVSVASVYRWTLAGLDGVRMRRFKIGGSW